MSLINKNHPDFSLEFSGIDNLSKEELVALGAAWDNLMQDDLKQRGKVDDSESWRPFGALEATDKAKIALDPDAFQIMRITAPALPNPKWVRFGFERVGGYLKTFIRPSMFEDVDLAKETPEVARHLTHLWERGERVIALLGAARLEVNEGMLLIEAVQSIVNSLSEVAYITGGYRGQSTARYGVTRAGYDVPKSLGKETLVIMPEAGRSDAHQFPTSMSFRGSQWGDDTPALSAASDGAIFFRNIPDGKGFGAWTQVEIATFTHLGKPCVLVDPSASKEQSVEVWFGKEIAVFLNPIDAARYLADHLPASSEVEARQPLGDFGTSLDDQIHEKDVHAEWMAVRLMYLDMHYARWVSQTANLATFEKYGFEVPDDEEAYTQDGRNLVLDGYWKDIMLLQHYKKIPDEGQADQLIKGYAKCRKQVKVKFGINGQDSNKSRVGWKPRYYIAKIWFIFEGEHNPRVIRAIEDLELNSYERHLQKLNK